MECGLRSRGGWICRRVDRRAALTSMPGSSTAPPSGMTDSIRSFLASWVAVIKTRVEIISVEIEEQREWIEQLLLLAVAAAFCLAVGMILFTFFFVVLFWESHP